MAQVEPNHLKVVTYMFNNSDDCNQTRVESHLADSVEYIFVQGQLSYAPSAEWVVQTLRPRRLAVHRPYDCIHED